jgi:hypothetical protein
LYIFLCLLLVLTLWYGWYGHTNTIPIYWKGRRSRGRMVVGFTTVQTVLFTTKVVSLNSAHGEVSLIQHYVINFIWIVTGQWFFSEYSTNKTDCHVLMFKLDHAYHTFASFIFNRLNNPAVSEKIIVFGISTKKTYIIITIWSEMWNLG